ncbi:MAG: DUF2961 domain-containing protein [Planctomycetia bacterium]|jgi:hypothetical protein
MKSVRLLRKVLLIAAVFAMFAGSMTLLATADDLADIATVKDLSSHRASSFDRTGENTDNIMGLAPGEAHVMLDTDGPGRIGHIWMTVSYYNKHETFLRDLVIRIYWEGSKVPSVEAPLGDFFGLGHGKRYKVRSAPVCVGDNDRALNCYWPMPFYKHARVEIYNNGSRSIRRIYYNVDYQRGKIAPDQALFHAQFRRVKELPPKPFTRTGEDNFVILDTQGEGQYLGCFFYVDSAPGGWWGEGDEMIHIDGEKLPSITGTGTEDYFCNAWGFGNTFNYPFYGVPLLNKSSDGWKQTSAYRFHIPSPVRFKKSIRVSIEHHWGKKVTNDYSCVAFWYQRQPTTVRMPIPKAEKNHPRVHPEKNVTKPTSLQLCGTEFEAVLRANGTSVKAVTLGHRDGFKGAALRIDTQNRPVTLTMPALAPGQYQVKVGFTNLEKEAPITVGVKGHDPKTVTNVGEKGEVVDLGTVTVEEGKTPELTLQSAKPVAVDYIRFNRKK